MSKPGRPLVIGLAGHVDHGKTSLVRALTGVDTDQLEEERRRGLTIELGFAHTVLPSGLPVSFVDVPGHERFVRTMVSGVSGIDAAMLVVDARESVRAQTREHVDILRLIGVRRVIAVISKCDLVNKEELGDVERDLTSLLGASCHATVACSAKTNAGLDDVRTILESLQGDERCPAGDAPFRMPIDRSFTIRGSGTVVTGTVWHGTARVGDTLECAPAGGELRVRGIQVRNQNVDTAGPGQRAALNVTVSGIPPKRGDDAVQGGHLMSSRRLTVALELLPSHGRALRSGARVLAMLGTRAEPASVKLVNTRAIEPGERALVQLIFSTPVIASGSQPLLLRSGSPETTIGGGTVRSVFAPGLGRGDTAWHEQLNAIEDLSPAERLETAAWMLGERSWPTALVHQEAGVWSEPTPGVRFGSGRIAKPCLETLTARVHERVKSDSDGGAVERSRIVAAMPNRASVDVLAALDHLIATDALEETATGVRPANDDARLTPSDRAVVEKIRLVYESFGPAPLPLDEAAQQLPVRLNEARRLINLAAECGVLVHVSGVLFIAAPVAVDIHRRVRSLLSEQERVTVGDIRAMLGISRKHAVLICEYLDRAQVTRRIGNDRVLFEQESAKAGGTP